MRKTLKLIAMLLCVAAVATLSSCSKDNEVLIIGKWEIVKCTDNLLGEDNSIIGKIWEFKTGGILSSDGYNASYSINGNNIAIWGGLFSGTITTLTKQNLVLDLVSGFNPDETKHYEFKKI